jgi:hypothetical protein
MTYMHGSSVAMCVRCFIQQPGSRIYICIECNKKFDVRMMHKVYKMIAPDVDVSCMACTICYYSRYKRCSKCEKAYREDATIQTMAWGNARTLCARCAGSRKTAIKFRRDRYTQALINDPESEA